MENIRSLKTEADYDWAIVEITRYFDNEPEVGSLDGDRFDVLATLIETYENKRYLIEASDPDDGSRPSRIQRLAVSLCFRGMDRFSYAARLGSTANGLSPSQVCIFLPIAWSPVRETFAPAFSTVSNPIQIAVIVCRSVAT